MSGSAGIDAIVVGSVGEAALRGVVPDCCTAVRSRPCRPGSAQLVLCVLALLISVQAAGAAGQDHPGKAVYDRWCAGCHGVDGQGGGPAAAYMLPRPRDFVRAQYQIRTTRSGSLPTDADILRVIDEGMPGTAMPGWRNALSQQERNDLVAYVKTFSRFFETDVPDVLELGRAPGSSDEIVAQGRDAYQQLECFKCHGDAARGDGPSASTQEDDNAFPIRPANLTQPWTFNGGATVEDIYRTLRTGLDGTPMPSLSDALEAGVVTDEQLWAIAYFVHSLGPEQPVVREIVEAKRVDGELPGSPEDAAWDGIERHWIPLAGQIIVKPRWFSPAVTGVWVQAVHDGTSLAMRLSWSDRSNSPDPEWAEWRARVTGVMEPREAVGAAVFDSAGEAVEPPPSPDAIAVWFPRTIPAGMERPYFFMGNARDPVYVWRWDSRGGATEMLGRGPGLLDPLQGPANGLTDQSTFDRGEWRVQFNRPLAAADSANSLTFASGQPIPIAFFAWDGDNGESGTRGSLSTWYFVYLTEPTSGSVYAAPLIATLLTAGLGIFVVGRAQRRDRNGDSG